jgi:hypothetical protein
VYFKRVNPSVRILGFSVLHGKKYNDGSNEKLKVKNDEIVKSLKSIYFVIASEARQSVVV